jgi:hypothetical protein
VGELRPDDAAAWRDFAAFLSRRPVTGDDRDLAAAERADVLANGEGATARALPSRSSDRQS